MTKGARHLIEQVATEAPTAATAGLSGEGPKQQASARRGARRRSFVVRFSDSTAPSGGPEVLAHVSGDDRAPSELHLHGFTLAKPVLDIVSQLLVEIAREEECEQRAADVAVDGSDP